MREDLVKGTNTRFTAQAVNIQPIMTQAVTNELDQIFVALRVRPPDICSNWT